MHASAYRKGVLALALLGASLAPLAPASAETVMQQCGQQYQAAKVGNTLNGMTWNQFRVDCAARLKASPAAASVPTTAPSSATASAPAAAPANPLKPTPAVAPATPAPAPAASAEETPPEPTAAPATTTAAGKPLSPGRAAERTRIKACGVEWKANKATLVAATPGLKWPQYWHTCNTRMKAAGQ